MDLYRVFNWDGASEDGRPGGPLFVPKAMQGTGRHDLPHKDGVLYCSRTALSAIAEFLQGFRNSRITPAHFRRPDGLVRALARYRLEDPLKLADLDDPRTLSHFKVKPSQVITHDRSVTQRLAETLYDSGFSGILWPSALEASWTNVSLFENRVRKRLTLAAPPERLDVRHPAVREAMAWLHIR